jgi:protein YIPF1/2
LLSIVCLYGYSLAVYIPVAILWTIQVSFLQWLLVLTAAFLSGSVLINILLPSLKASKYSLFLIIGIGAAHFLLAAGFMLSFFHSVQVATSAVHGHESVRAIHEAVNATQ